jgi:hypothetical protein
VRKERRSYLGPIGTIHSGPGIAEYLLPVTSSQFPAIFRFLVLRAKSAVALSLRARV